MEEHKKIPRNISRRSFLKGAVAFTGVILAGKIGEKLLGNNRTQKLTRAPTVIDISSEKPPAVKTDSDIKNIETANIPKAKNVEIFGVDEQIKNTEDLENLHNQFNSIFRTKLEEKALSQKDAVPTQKWEQRQYLLNPDKRYLQVCIKKSLFDKFQNEAKKGGLDAASWLQKHVDVMNAFIKGGINPPDLLVELKRVIVVSDSFDDQISDHQRIPEYPLDIDALWGMWRDYRGDLDPKTGVPWKSAYLQKVRVDGIQMEIDYALIHEWYHMILNWPDEYIENVEGVEGMPNLNIEGAGGIETRTYWSGYFLNRVRKLGIRGYYTDPRGLGVVGYSHDKDSAAAVFAEIPKKTSFIFKSSSGEPIQGSISVFKVKTNGDYYGKKSFSLIQNLPLQDGKMETIAEWFTPNVMPEGQVISPTNWFLDIKTRNGEEIGLHLPVAGFNITKMSGLEEANYEIVFLEALNSLEYKTQLLKMIKQNDTNQDLKGRHPIAFMKIDGSPINFIWVAE